MDKYIDVINDVSNHYEYPNNIRHLLYVIIPAFVIKYGNEYERIILECLSHVKIVITDKNDSNIQASYISYPYLDNNIKTKKMILLNNYNDVSYLELIDNIIHEFNHAVNSYKNEITFDNENIYLRTGLTKIKYDKTSLKAIGKDKSFILEEIINVKQTENIIEIIKTLDSNNYEVKNTLDAIKNYNFSSSSYFSLKYYCEELLNNKTFLLTLEKLRINGNIDDIPYWYDGIYGESGYNLLIDKLYSLYELIKKEKVLFRKRKIKSFAIDLIKISSRFNKNCNLK